MLEKIAQVKTWTIEQVLWAEKNLKGKSGAEKKAAVIKKLDDMITLPSYLEWADDVVIGLIVDKACATLNEFAGHNFGELKELTEKQAQILAGTIEDPKEKKS